MAGGTYGKFGTDKSLETEGAVCDLGEAGVYLLARAGGANSRFTAMVRKLTQPHRRQLIAGTLDADIANRLNREAFAKTCLIKWFKKGEPLPRDPGSKGDPVLCEHDVTGPDGNPLPYTVENAVKLLTDLPDLFDDLMAFSTSTATFQREEVEAEGKPSATT